MNNQLRTNLPHKELSLFKRIVKCYEQKQFKNGLKFAKQILSNPKFSEHGETLAMKGLILSCMGKREEAYELVKSGIRNDINSSICWHVYGLVQKSDRKYDEAMKCYLRALKMDKDNIQILRDLSLLQIQMRNYEGYLETRGQLFQLRPTQKASWLGYVVAQHLLENYDEAVRIMEEFTKVQQNIPPYNYEHSELLIYYAMILTEAGKLNEALNFLLNNESQIVDKLNLQDCRGDLYLKLQRFSEAEQVYTDLIDRNPDNEFYYYKLIESKEIPPNDEEAVTKLFDELITKYPKALMPRWIPLKQLSGDKFRFYADDYIKRCLRKGVWALFVQLKFLYSDPHKRNILEELYERYKHNIYEYQTLEGPDADIEPPSTEIFVNYLLAQHYSHMGRVSDALEIVENQLCHTPTLIDFYALKGRIYYDAGNSYLASKCLDEAQSLDTADRYVNCLCTRYMVESGRFKDAEEMAAKFTREGMRSVDNLNEMQCMWFLNTVAGSNLKLRKFADALQKCHEVNKHFSVMVDDQFDFHSYCLRKTTLRSYVELLRTEDKLKEHRFFFDTARTAIEIYLHIHESPVGPEGDDESLNMENLSISEAKKLRNKQRRLKKKAENEAIKRQQEQERREQIQKAKTTQDKEEMDVVEEKIDGSKLIRTQVPLDEAMKFLQPLLQLAPGLLETQCLSFRVYRQKEKLLLMLRAIVAGLRIEGSQDDPEFHECLITFLCLVNKMNNRGNDDANNKTKDDDIMWIVIKKVIDKYFADGVQRKRLIEINRDFAERNRHSIRHQFYAWHINNIINTDNKIQLTDLSEIENFDIKADRWQDCDVIFSKLKDLYKVKESDDVYQRLKAKFSKSFPYCTSFMTCDEIEYNQNTPVVVTPSHFYPNAAATTDKVVNGFTNNTNDSINNNESHLNCDQTITMINTAIPAQ